MQNSQTNSASPAFNQAASLNEEEQLRLKIAAQKSPLLDRAYGRLERKEQKKQDEIKRQFEENRESSLKAMTNQVMDKRMKEMHPELKPKHLPTVSREQLAKEAKESAEKSYKEQQKAAMEQAKQESLKEKRAFVAEITGPRNLKGQFNQASRDQSR